MAKNGFFIPLSVFWHLSYLCYGFTSSFLGIF